MSDGIARTMKLAVRDLMIQNLPDLFPITTLTEPTTLGGITAKINAISVPNDPENNSRFVQGSRVGFDDGSGERMLTVSNVSSDGQTLSFERVTRLGWTGFEQDHVQGARVYANALAYAPFAPSNVLELGDPIIFVTVRKGLWSTYGQGFGFPTYHLAIQSNRLLNRTSDRTESEMWVEEQESKTTDDLESIANLLTRNQSLVTNYGTAAALQFGDASGGGELFQMDYGPRRVENTDTWHYIGTARAIITAAGQPQR